MNNTKIGVVILNYNTWKLTVKCIQKLKQQLVKYEYRIYIVDNQSSIQPSQQILNYFLEEHICLIKAEENKGYSAGNNLGIKKALYENCSAILISNSDVIYHPSCIERLLNTLESDDTIGIVGPNVRNTDGTRQWATMFTTTGMKEKYLARSICSVFSKKFQKQYFGLDKKLDQNEEVAAIAGCCFMLSNSCARQMYPLDENTFLYEEELILAWKMKEKKYRTILVTGAEVVHIGGVAVNRVKAMSFIHFVNSELYYCKTYLKAPAIQIIPLYFIRTLSYFYRMIKLADFRRNSFRYFKETIPRLLSIKGLLKSNA